jgi:hypothetical protein
MITIFNRKKLAVDTSSQEITRITLKLKAAGIKYELHTSRSQSSFGMMLHGSMSAGIGHGAGGANAGIGSLFFVYTVYVARKDFERAKEAIN